MRSFFSEILVVFPSCPQFEQRLRASSSMFPMMMEVPTFLPFERTEVWVPSRPPPPPPPSFSFSPCGQRTCISFFLFVLILTLPFLSLYVKYVFLFKIHNFFFPLFFSGKPHVFFRDKMTSFPCTSSESPPITRVGLR